MEQNSIELKFDPTIARLAGFPYGEKIYNDQVRGKLDFAVQAQIVFPNHIIKIASSFVQGFFKDIVEQVGLEAIGKSVRIVSSSEKLTNSILSNLT